jgi:hypothetical protein
MPWNVVVKAARLSSMVGAGGGGAGVPEVGTAADGAMGLAEIVAVSAPEDDMVSDTRLLALRSRELKLRRL